MTPYNAQGRGVLQIMILSVYRVYFQSYPLTMICIKTNTFTNLNTMATMISSFMSKLFNGLFKNKDSQGKKAVDRLLHASG